MPKFCVTVLQEGVVTREVDVVVEADNFDDAELEAVNFVQSVEEGSAVYPLAWEVGELQFYSGDIWAVETTEADEDAEVDV